jgi:hypothetical protein
MAVGATDWTAITTALAAVAAVIAAISIPLTAYARRPRVRLHVDTSGTHSRLEGSADQRLPWIRLLASNGRRRRAATGARVLVEGYRAAPEGSEVVRVGSPSLGWTSQPDAALGIFAGETRSVDLGTLIKRSDRELEVAGIAAKLGGGSVISGPDTIREGEAAVRWHFALALHEVVPLDARHVLRPNAWFIELRIGSDDGPSNAYVAQISWNSTAATAEQALDSFHIALKRR